MNGRGSIYAEAAYAQGKMLDHSSWNSILPRLITPSDIDMAIDNRGEILFIEVSSSTPNWYEIPKGQRRLYESLLRNSTGNQAAALVRHSVPKDRQINTRTDIDEFSIMANVSPRTPKTSDIFHGNERWQEFVTKWIEDAGRIMRWFAQEYGRADDGF